MKIVNKLLTILQNLHLRCSKRLLMLLCIYCLKTEVHRLFSVHKREYTGQTESRLCIHFTQRVMAAL